MAKNKTTPLKQIFDKEITDLGPDDLDKLKDLDLENLDLSNIDLSNVNFDKVKKDAIGDIAFALDPRIGSIIPKKEDTSVIDKRIAQIEKPTTTSVWDKQAAYYRQTGEGAVLRTQKDIGALFNPAIDMWTKRTAMANAKFEMLKQQIPEFDESIIFGDQTDTPIPIVNEVKNISMSVKEDLRTLSRMNVNDPRYDELRKKVEKDQKVIVQFDEINQKLLKIRNDVDIQGINSDEWSKGMTPSEREMWMDIMTSKGEKITIENGKVMWTGGEGVSYEFNPEKFDDMIAYADGVKEDVRKIEGLNFGHVCRTSENSATIIAQYIDEEAMTNATPKFREIMGGMRQYFTSPPNPAEAEIIWKSHN